MKQKTTLFKQLLFGAFVSLGFTAMGQTMVTKNIDEIADVKAMEKMDSMYTQLDEIKIISSYAIDRKTPVAYSTLSVKTINEQLGSQELPEVLKMTPAVYATKQGGGVGDARINIRGFDQTNIAVLINGVPVNDMENGRVYWSNWAGLGDAIETIQVQRGLGASRLAINSVGGTMNLITKSTNAKESTFAEFSATDYGKYKALIGYNSGKLANNSAISVVLSSTQGNGWANGTYVKAYSYFFSYAKELSKNHRLVFTALGAPQEHGQRDRMLSRAEVTQFGGKYNKDLGYITNEDGEMVELNQRNNYYHKPQIALNHYWNIDSKSQLNTSAYFSFGHGGGSGPLGDYAPVYGNGAGDMNGYINWDAAVSENEASADGGSATILRNSVNNHTWVGALSTYSRKINDNLNLIAGIDARTYTGEHFREVRNLLGGQHWEEKYKYAVDSRPSQNMGISSNATSYWNVFAETAPENRIAYDNDGQVGYGGAFGQFEYTKDKLSAFLAGSLSSTTYTRIDRYNYLDVPTQTSESITIPGYNFKLGANYNVDELNNIYVNYGLYSRAPFFGFMFQNYQNILSDNTVNEGVQSFEVGYGYKSKITSLNVNAYQTIWTNKTLLSGRIPTADGGTTRALIQGVGAIHQGVELEMTTKVADNIALGAIASVGDWRWSGDATYQLQSDIDQSITEGAAYTDGLYVGNAPQTQLGGRARWQFTDVLDFGATYIYNDRLYASYDPSDYETEADKSQPYQLPSFGQLDLRFGWKTSDKGYLQVQCFNALDYQGFIEGVNNSDGTDIQYGFTNWGRNFNISYKINF
jgi:hypothetical protein